MINPEQVVMLIYVEIVLDQKHAESRLYNCVYLWNVHSKNWSVEISGLNMPVLICTLKVSF